MSLYRNIEKEKSKFRVRYAESLSIYKPHGSLDWFEVDGEAISSDVFSGRKRLIITPGDNKFKAGYGHPFDAHREMANKEIDRAKRFLVIGYGFNDEHLQPHLISQIEKGTPTVILTRNISNNLLEYVQDKPNVWVVCRRESMGGFKLIVGKEEYEFDGQNIWDLQHFVNEVLE